MGVVAATVHPGDRIVIGQAAAEPPTLVAELLDLARETEGLSVLCGYTLDPAWEKATPGHPAVTAYAAHGSLRSLTASGTVEMLPVHLSRVEGMIAGGRLPVDVVLLQVGPMDDEGYFGLGASVDYAVVAAERARAVLVEVNPAMPRTHARRRLHHSLVTRVIETHAPLVGSPSRPATDVELDVAHHVAALVPDGATIQLGASALAEAIAAELHSRRNLTVRSGLVGDWLVGLYEAGAMADGPASTVASLALGTERLYRFLDGESRVMMTPMSELLAPAALAARGPFFAMNSAIEVDVLGQVNAEVVGGRYVGAVGGAVDFFRAAQATDGLAIVALAAGSGERSRIVAELGGPVATSKSDVDVVVTEWGVADLRAAGYAERVAALAAVADPAVRASLLAAAPGWVGVR